MVLSAVNNNLNSIYTPLNILTIITLGVSILLQQIIYVGHKTMSLSCIN